MDMSYLSAKNSDQGMRSLVGSRWELFRNQKSNTTTGNVMGGRIFINVCLEGCEIQSDENWLHCRI